MYHNISHHSKGTVCERWHWPGFKKPPIVIAILVGMMVKSERNESKHTKKPMLISCKENINFYDKTCIKECFTSKLLKQLTS